MQDENGDMKDYLARIRKTIADSENLVSMAQLRIAETDRMLESQGLTREQVMNFRFTEEQRRAANEELKRRGLEPLEDLELDGGYGDEDRSQAGPWSAAGRLDPGQQDSELAERQRKFGMMMKPFQI